MRWIWEIHKLSHHGTKVLSGNTRPSSPPPKNERKAIQETLRKAVTELLLPRKVIYHGWFLSSRFVEEQDGEGIHTETTKSAMRSHEAGLKPVSSWPPSKGSPLFQDKVAHLHLLQYRKATEFSQTHLTTSRSSPLGIWEVPRCTPIANTYESFKVL